jgi:hypothetical protein
LVAAVVALVFEHACLWALTNLVMPPLSLVRFAFAAAFAVAYVVWVATLRLQGPTSSSSSLGDELLSNIVSGLAVLMLVEVVVYLSMDVMGLWIGDTKVVAIVAVAGWLALGWRFVNGDTARSADPARDTTKLA